MKDNIINVFDKVNVKLTQNDIEAWHLLGDSRKTLVRFVNQKHSLEALKNKKILITVDLTSIGLGKKTNLFLSQNLSDYNNKTLSKSKVIKRKKSLISAYEKISRSLMID